LHYAVDKAGYDITELLLDLGANVNAVDIDKRTPLHGAIDNFPGKVSFPIERLIAKGANVNAVDKNGVSLLHYVARTVGPNAHKHYSDLVNSVLITERASSALPILIKRGANFSVKNEEGQTILDIVPEKYLEKLRRVIDALHLTPLHIAAQAGELSKIRELLKVGANTAATDRLGRTPLHIAAAEGHLDIVKALVNDAKNKCKVKRSKDRDCRQGCS
jgi:ankyrin repeat protein